MNLSAGRLAPAALATESRGRKSQQRACSYSTLLPRLSCATRPRRLAAAAFHSFYPTHSLTRRAVAGIALAGGGMAAAGRAQAALGGLQGGARRTPRSLVASGSDKFLQGDVRGSLADYDEASAADASLRPYLWQRGISAYYAGEFATGAAQFRADVAVNPNDTEEAIWAFLCEAQLRGAADARQHFLQVGQDPRPIMRAAYECFSSGDPPQQILDAAGSDETGHDRFYALLYEGLWHEAEGDAVAAETALLAATETSYGLQSPDYMTAVARVHCQQRGWPSAA